MFIHLKLIFSVKMKKYCQIFDIDEYTKQFQNGIMIMKTLKNCGKNYHQNLKIVATYFKVLITLSERI